MRWIKLSFLLLFFSWLRSDSFPSVLERIDNLGLYIYTLPDEIIGQNQWTERINLFGYPYNHCRYSEDLWDPITVSYINQYGEEQLVIYMAMSDPFFTQPDSIEITSSELPSWFQSAMLYTRLNYHSVSLLDTNGVKVRVTTHLPSNLDLIAELEARDNFSYENPRDNLCKIWRIRCYDSISLYCYLPDSSAVR